MGNSEEIFFQQVDGKIEEKINLGFFHQLGGIFLEKLYPTKVEGLIPTIEEIEAKLEEYGKD